MLTLILCTFLGPLQNFLDTVGLTFGQWLICLGLSVTILVVSEIWKALRRRAGGAVPVPDPARRPVPTSA